MNTVTHEQSAKHAAPARATRPFATLIKRELWEHRGGFVTAPAVVSAIIALLILFALAAGQYGWQRARSGNFTATVNGVQVPAQHVSLSELIKSGSPSDFAQMGQALDGLATGLMLLPLVVTGFVVAFYLINTLHDERKDRSVLFWKSMPVSDAATVWSKVVTALVVSPLISLAIGAVLVLVVAVLGMGFLAANGANPMLVLAHANPALVIGRVLAMLPAYMLTALCTAGWFLLCSAWARNKPVLWAFGVPALIGAVLSTLAGMGTIAISPQWFWQNVFTHMVTGTIFGVHVSNQGFKVRSMGGLGDPMVSMPLHALTQPIVWIAAAAGIAMIFAAIRLRRWRDEA